ncbi:MAG: ankyrin repeat domain-containing protein [Candidatus Algichlamydia australiensis]|nr:ankyrin repeat domain-containing protein [Chlamydiales bacterium]
MVIDKNTFAQLVAQLTPDAIPFLSGEITDSGEFLQYEKTTQAIYEKARTSLSKAQFAKKKEFLIKKAEQFAETHVSEEPADTKTIEKAQKVLETHPHFRSIFNKQEETPKEAVEKKSPEGPRRVKATNRVIEKFQRTKDTFSYFELLDHLLFFKQHESEYTHPLMKNYQKLISGFKENKDTNLTKIINASWSADKKLLAASVYERITGQTFPLADIYETLTAVSPELEQPLSMKDFPTISPRAIGENPDAKLREGIFTSNFIKVREAIYQRADLYKKLPPFGWTPLHFAIATGDINIVYLLLQHGAYQPEKTETPEEREPDELLADDSAHETAVQLSPLELALSKNCYTIAAQLVSAGARVTQKQIDAIHDEYRQAEIQKAFVFQKNFQISKNRKEIISRSIPESLPFDWKERETLAEKGETFCKKLDHAINKQISTANQDKTKKVSIETKNKNIEDRYKAKRTDPEIVQSFAVDNMRNPCFIALREKNFLNLGRFGSKLFIEHDTISQLFSKKKTEFLETILNQHGYRGCNENIIGSAMVMGLDTLSTEEGNKDMSSKGYYFNVAPKFQMDVVEKEDSNSFEVKVTTTLFLGLQKSTSSYPICYLKEIVETYLYKHGKLVDYKADKS